jgi:signal transduction histidine kinase
MHREQRKQVDMPEPASQTDLHQFRFMKKSSYFIVPVGLSYSALYTLFGYYSAAISQAVIMLLVIPILVYFDKNHVPLEPYGHIMTSATLLSVINSAWFFGGTSTPGLVWFAVALIPSILFLKRSTTILWLTISALSVVGFVFAEQILHITIPFPPEFLLTFKLFTIAGAAVYIFVFLYASRITSEQAVAVAQENERAAQEANDAKSQFLTKMSHELRTPLNAIMGYAELIQEELDEGEVAPEDIQRDIYSIQRAGQVLTLHLSNILDLSKIERGQFETHTAPIYLPELLRQLSNQMYFFERESQVHFTIDNQTQNDFRFVSDEKSISCILSNLLDNAFKFTKQGTILLRVSQTNDELIFEVIDEGIGICPTQLERIFQSFVQVEEGSTRSYDGIGIGLTLSQQLVLRLDGTLSVTSQQDKGTTFTFMLPYMAVSSPE